MNITDIYEDSPNGYLITTEQPPNIDDAIKYYLAITEVYPPSIYPLEYAMVNYGMGILLLGDKSKPPFSEERAKRIENALYHLNQAMNVFNYKDYPVMFGLVSIFMSLLFMERAGLITPRSFLAKRSTPEESVQYGLDTILEVFPIVHHSNKHTVEHALCCYVTGWLYVSQSEYLDNIQDNSIREQAITYLERCIRILKEVRKLKTVGTTVLVLHNHNRDDKKHKVTRAGSYLDYDPNLVTTFPTHVKLLTKGYSMNYIEGNCYYLLGRLHQGWLTITVRHREDGAEDSEGEEKVDEPEPLYTRNARQSNEQYDGTPNKRAAKLAADDPNNMDSEIYNYRQAFEYLSLAIKPKYLNNDCVQWADAHHRIASIVVKYPVIVDPDYVAPAADKSRPPVRNSDLYLDVAISHMVLALRSPLNSPVQQMDLNFHIAQSYITKLQLIIDATPIGQSVTRNIINTDSVDVIQNIESFLKDAVKRVTAASTQSTQEGYLYYFSCLKVSEYRMLEAACRPELTSDDRNFFLKDSVEYLVDALMSRPLVDNVDLHYVASAQMSAMLMSCKKTFAACKSYCKTLLVLCVMLNRALFNPETAAQARLADEMVRQTTQAMVSSARDVFWVKKHFGAFNLNERLQAGYAAWSFEDGPSVKVDESKMITNFSKGGDNGTQGSEDTDLHLKNTGAASGASSLTKSSAPFHKAAPPPGVPPLKLAPLSTKKMATVGGKRIVPLNEEGDGDDEGEKELDAKPDKGLGIKPHPPTTGMPLSAMGHNPDYKHAPGQQLQGGMLNHTVSGVTAEPEEQEEPYFYSGPYGRRMRKRVPPLKDMIDIDRKVRAQFGFGKGKAVFLMPAYTTVDNEGSSAAFSKKKLEGDHDHRDAQIKRPEADFSRAGTHSEGGGRGASKADGGEMIDKDIVLFNAHKDDDDEDEFDGDDDLTDEGDFDFANANSKRISSKYHASANNNGKDGSKRQKTMEEVTALSMRKMVAAKGPLKQETVMGWMFKGFVAATKRTPQPKRKDYDKGDYYKQTGSTQSFLNPFQTKTKVDKRAKDADPEDAIQMWCSTQCYCAFMLLSRMSRMQLVMQSRRFHMLDSERTNYILYHLRQSYVSTYMRLKEQLYADCAKLIIPPTTLKDVSSRSYLELQVLFKSNVKLCRRLDEWEQFIYYKVSKYDYYLPLVAINPIFLRDVAAFDNTLLNPNKLVVNLTYEERVEALIAKNEEYQARLRKDKAKEQSKHNADGRNNDDFFSYDSASHAATSTIVSRDKDGKTVNPLVLEQQRLRQEEKDEVLAGKMSLPLSQAMDGSNYLKNGQQGVRDMLTQYLAHDECLMTWHLPHAANQNIQVVLAWRDNSASTHTYYSSAEALSHSQLYEQMRGNKGANKHKEPQTDAYRKKKRLAAQSKKTDGSIDPEQQLNKGIILEIAKSDLDTGRLMQLIANYISALHAESAPQRTTLTTDALRSLSCALSLTEFLNMIPPHVRSLVICCPAVMRVIPWHLVLIEMSSDYGTGQLSAEFRRYGSKPVEIHLMEKFCVRLGPTLTLWEMVNTSAKYHKQSVGMHRLCAVDAEAEGERSTGLRGSDLEVACISQIWSLDPLDYHILMNHSAAPRNMQTGLFADGSNNAYRKFKRAIYVQRFNSVNPIKMKSKLKKTRADEGNGSSPDKRKADKYRNEAGDIDAEKLFGAMDETTHVKVTHSPNKNKYKRTNADGTAKKANYDGEDSEGEGDSDESHHSSEDDLEEAQKEDEFNMRSLSMCRVLHITSAKVPQQLIAENSEGGREDATGFEAAIRLPKYEKHMTVNNKKVKLTDPRTYLTTSDLIRQVYVQNNALTMFSKFGLTDDITNVYSSEIEINTSFIEAAHLAGANTVVHPLWSADSMGHGLTTLAHMIFQVRFYSILPSKSRDHISIVETVRRTQLWLKDATADAIIAFIFKASIPPTAKKIIIDELEGVVEASLSAEERKHKSDMTTVAPSKAPVSILAADAKDLTSPFLAPGDGVTVGNRVGGDKKFFDHFLLWGSYAVSGQGGGVHHPNLTEEGDEGFDKGIIAWDDKELNDLAMEARMLHLEGKHEEATALEKYIRMLRNKMVTDRLRGIQSAGVRAGRGFMDGLDYLDKKYLDQDSDSIELSSEDSESEPDSNDEDVNEEVEEQNRKFDEDDPLSPNYVPKRRVFKPKPLELDNLKPENMAFSEWRSKMAKLNTDVKAPVVDAARLANKKAGDVVKQNQEENYELNMRNKTNANIDGQTQVTEAMRAAKAARQAKLDKRYKGMNPEQIAMAKAKRKVEKKARREAREKRVAEREAEERGEGDSDDDDETDSEEERERLEQERRKRERQSKYKQFRGDVKDGVRSYGEIVNDITDGKEGCIIT